MREAVPPMTEWVGYLAATITTLSFVPQVIQVWRTRSAADISFGMYAGFMVGVALWVLYGIRIHAWPVIAANSVTLVLAASILVGKARFGR